MSEVAALPTERLERELPEIHPPFTPKQALDEANRCLYCHDAPCVRACPTAIDIPEFIRRIATGNVVGAAQTILEANILGLSCARVCPTEVLCAGSCVYEHTGERPIDIGRLQRYATEHVHERGIRLFEAGAPTGRKVLCVGAGPASLACAAELARLGHHVTIREARALPGGLNTTGVAPYKMYADDALREIAYVLGIGNIELVCDSPVTAQELPALAEHYDAVFLGIGLGGDMPLGIPGDDAPGVVGALALIERLKTAPREEAEALRAVRHAVVVGGGNTALDVAHELAALGIEDVCLVYRRDEASMSGYRHEVAGARLAGARMVFRRSPVQVVLDARGRARGLEVVENRLVAREGGGRPAIEPIPGTESVLPAELIVSAIGQERLTDLVAGLDGVAIERGRIVVDPETGRTGLPWLYAGGDCANGAREVVDAVYEGKRAARAIHAACAARPEED